MLNDQMETLHIKYHRERKNILPKKINLLLDPFREKRAYYEGNINEVRDIILISSKKANIVGNETVEGVQNTISYI